MQKDFQNSTEYIHFSINPHYHSLLIAYVCMKELGGHHYFLIKFFFYYKRRSNLNFRATKAIIYIYHKYFVVTLKLINYADNMSLKSLPASFFMIFRGNSCIEAK